MYSTTSFLSFFSFYQYFLFCHASKTIFKSDDRFKELRFLRKRKNNFKNQD